MLALLSNPDMEFTIKEVTTKSFHQKLDKGEKNQHKTQYIL